jgi:hypothetical protein
MNGVTLEEFLRTSPYFRDLVEEKGVEWVKKYLEEGLLKEIEVLRAAYATPSMTPELQKALAELHEYTYQKSFG